MSDDLNLEPARQVMAADGIGLSLIELRGADAHLLLSVIDADCAECVLPRHMLEPVVLDLLRPANPDLRAVHIVDPRESPESDPTPAT